MENLSHRFSDSRKDVRELRQALERLNTKIDEGRISLLERLDRHST